VQRVDYFFSPGLAPRFPGLFTDTTELIRFLLILFLFFYFLCLTVKVNW